MIENFKVGALDRLGLGYDRLRAVNPRLVHCSISGYGSHGPYAQRPGYDVIAQGMGGVMSVTGEPDGRPLLGEHTEEVLRERLGLSPEEIASLRDDGAIRPSAPMTDLTTETQRHRVKTEWNEATTETWRHGVKIIILSTPLSS